MNKSSIIIGSLILITIISFYSIRVFYHITGGNGIFEEIERIEFQNHKKDSSYCINWNDSVLNQETTKARFEKLMINSNDYDGIDKKIFPIYERFVMKIYTKEKQVKLSIKYSGPDQPVYIDVMWPEVYVDKRISYGMSKFLDSLCTLQ